MRTILKIIAAPFVLALMLIVAVLSFLACIAGACCGLACTVFVLLAACAFFAGCIRAVLLLWCWRSLFPPLGSRPLESGCWIVCMG